MFECLLIKLSTEVIFIFNSNFCKQTDGSTMGGPEAPSKYHKHIKLTLEKSPSKFLDTKLFINSGIYETQLYRKELNIAIHWSCNIPKKYQRTASSVDLH